MSFGSVGRGMTVCCLMICGLSVFAQTQVEEHWSPYDYPQEIPAGVQHHIIADGDTLWSLAGQYLNNPLLWPHLYQANNYIQDPNLIYPGDPILLDVGVVVTQRTIADNLDGDGSSKSADGPETEEYADMREFEEASPDDDGSAADDQDITNVSQVTSFDADAAEFVILPAGDRSDMECSTYIYPLSSPREDLPFDFLVEGGENIFLTTFGFGDVIYLNKGSADGVKPGDQYAARRPVRKVWGSGSNKKRTFYGYAIDQVGRLRVLAVQEHGATAVVEESCFEVVIGDFLVPYEQEPIPLITELPVVDRYQIFDQTGAGEIIHCEDDLSVFGKGLEFNANLGINSNVAPGDLFIIYRQNPRTNLKKGKLLPVIYLGHAVALKTSATTTVMKVIEAFLNLKVGDQIVALRADSFATQ